MDRLDWQSRKTRLKRELELRKGGNRVHLFARLLQSAIFRIYRTKKLHSSRTKQRRRRQTQEEDGNDERYPLQGKATLVAHSAPRKDETPQDVFG